MAKLKRDEFRMNIIRNFQNNLSMLMQNKGVENKELSDDTGIALPDLTKYRRIEYNTLPRVTEIAKICKYFGVSFDFIIGLDPADRYAEISEYDQKLLHLYHLATPRDQQVIQTILSQYDVEQNEG